MKTEIIRNVFNDIKIIYFDKEDFMKNDLLPGKHILEQGDGTLLLYVGDEWLCGLEKSLHCSHLNDNLEYRFGDDDETSIVRVYEKVGGCTSMKSLFSNSKYLNKIFDKTENAKMSEIEDIANGMKILIKRLGNISL